MNGPLERDPWAIQRWAFGTKAGGSGRKTVLTALAMMAVPDSGRCEAKVSTLAQMCEMGDRTVRTHLAGLADDGLIARRPQFRADGGRRGDEYLMLAPWVAEWPDGAPLPNRPSAENGRGEASPQEGEAASPEAGEGASPAVAAQELPPGERPPRSGRSSGASADDAKMKIPYDFPDELRPHARAVLPLLRAVAEQHNAKEVLPLALARVMMAPERRRKPFVKAAHDFAAWAVDPPRAIKDVVGSYRTWLDRERDLQAIERVTPAAGTTGGAAVDPPVRRFTRED